MLWNLALNLKQQKKEDHFLKTFHLNISSANNEDDNILFISFYFSWFYFWKKSFCFTVQAYLEPSHTSMTECYFENTEPVPGGVL